MKITFEQELRYLVTAGTALYSSDVSPIFRWAAHARDWNFILVNLGGTAFMKRPIGSI